MLPYHRLLPRLSRPALAAGLPALAAAVALAWPCDCPDHTGTHAAHGVGGPAEVAVAGPHAGHYGMVAGPSSPRAAAHHEAMRFEVGTAERPIVAGGPKGPLWQPTPPAAPGRSSHGTFAELAVAEGLDELRAEKTGEPRAADAVATRAAVLTTAQATKKLSKKCQRLLKAKKRKLSKADRKRRTTCLAQRRKLVNASLPTPANPSVPSAPTAPIEGPKPTAAPPTTATPAPTTPSAPAPTTPTTEAPEKTYKAVGIRPTDSDPARWILTRGGVAADIVNVELNNTDSQVHDLWIAPGDADGQITDESAKQKLIGYLEPGERKAVDVALQPGIYIFICSIAGHETMRVKFIVTAP